jgi:hypothetical protein
MMVHCSHGSLNASGADQPFSRRCFHETIEARRRPTPHLALLRRAAFATRPPTLAPSSRPLPSNVHSLCSSLPLFLLPLASTPTSEVGAQALLAQHGAGTAAGEVLGGGRAHGAVERAARAAAPVVDGVVLDAHVVAVLALRTGRDGVRTWRAPTARGERFCPAVFSGVEVGTREKQISWQGRPAPQRGANKGGVRGTRSTARNFRRSVCERHM